MRLNFRTLPDCCAARSRSPALIQWIVVLVALSVVCAQKFSRQASDSEDYQSIARPSPRKIAHRRGLTQNPNLDDLVAAIATAAINGALPLHRMNLGNPNRRGDVLRIPILLIRPNDFKRKRPNRNGKNESPRNGRDYLKKDYSPKPKYPTHGLKVIPAPKEFEYEKTELKKNFEKKPINSIQINNRYNDRDRDLDYDREGYEENNANALNRLNTRLNEERVNRNRLNNYNQNEETYERLPVRQSDSWRELPERDPNDRPAEEDDYVDEKGADQLPALRPVLKVPAVVRHVYNAQPPTDSIKPTIPPRFLKGMADIPSTSGSSPEKYDNTQVYKGPITNIPSLRELLPPPEDQSVTYKTEPMVSHKYVNLGDVYRKTSEAAEPEEEPIQSEGDDGPLAGYAKDQYDKQLISTLTKLMSSSKNRSPLNIGGLSGGSESAQPAKPVTKSVSSFFTSSGQSAKSSSIPYTSQSQTSSSQSKIPESVLPPLTYSSGRTVSVPSGGQLASEYLSPIQRDQVVPLQPGQVPVLPEVSRKPVSLDLGFDSGARPLSAYSVFNAADTIGPSATKESSYQPLSQSMKTYVVSNSYRQQR